MGGTVTIGNSYPVIRFSSSSSIFIQTHQKIPLFRIQYRRTRNRQQQPSSSSVVNARLFGPSIFEASKLKVLFLGVDKEDRQHPGNIPRTYTFTHSDLTSNLTLSISQTINNSQVQGWYSKLQRDEVVAEWKKVKGKMSLHVHCHISGGWDGHFLLNLCAPLRYFIFRKELPLVLKAFVHGDGNLLNNYPELKQAMVWVYFHSDIPDFNKVECWGPLDHQQKIHDQYEEEESLDQVPKPCQQTCGCCFPPIGGGGGCGPMSPIN
ncbi:protein STAY-GREEN homolog, chloroplastic-like [Impatiens glandulifera]|uniref:protein STAY-GREEN homolog, chloroplastic-like n=1 Tax=Impatiens glandulifera TaxID=253017 RepID=UPI001FB19230|nr:protein STAY-GREEN homolog, chloroplastic-like [Impatiens glandulifera]